MNLNNFNLPYNNAYGIYFPLALLLCILIFSCKENKEKSDVVSLDTSNFLKGVFILIVVFHHFSQHLLFQFDLYDKVFIKTFENIGFLAVSIFFFLSGYALNYSKRNPSFFVFIKEKLFRVYVPCVIVNVFIALVINRFSFEILLPTAFDSTQWFITAILIFYLFDFIARKSPIKINIIISLIFAWVVFINVMNLGNWWYISSLAFPLGYIWTKTFMFISIHISDNKFLSSGVIFVLFLMSMFFKSLIPYITILVPLFFSALIIYISCRWEFSNSIISLIGKSSLEIYVLHMKLMWIMMYVMSKNKMITSFTFPVYLILLVFLSMFFSKLNSKILSLVKRR